MTGKRFSRLIPPVLLAACAAALVGLTLWMRPDAGDLSETDTEEPVLLYGIDTTGILTVEKEVSSGETLSNMLDGLVSQATVNRIAEADPKVFNVRNIVEGRKYVLFMSKDTSESPRLRHLVYEKSITDYVTVSLLGDSIVITTGQKPVRTERRAVSAEISSSLWNCIVDHDLPFALAAEMEDVFGWSVDFFALQNTDRFTMIFDERYLDSVRIGTGRIWGAVFNHGGKDYYAIPFMQDGKISYWDESGKSLRKQLLKAPLKYSRISSKFSYSRLHPVYKVRRPHLGVDYAAPSGTPVVAIADGTVTRRYWDGSGGGNTLRIRHANNLESAYLHLRGFASGITAGTHVSQGQLIGYVGMTGTATGPHLDFRLYRGGQAIDPLKAPSEPTEPIADSLMDAFSKVRQMVLDELAGEVPDSMRVNMDILTRYSGVPVTDTLTTQTASK